MQLFFIEECSITLYHLPRKEDTKAIKKSKKIFLFANKTSNIYQIKKDEYNKLTTDAIMSAYKKVPHKISNKANADRKKIIKNEEVVIK